jgi:hypothetical protein
MTTTKKISVQELKQLISNTIKEELSLNGVTSLNESTNWDELKYLYGRGKLSGSWKIIMSAMSETGGDKNKAFNLLKIATAKLGNEMYAEPKPKEEEPATEEELLDFSKLV